MATVKEEEEEQIRQENRQKTSSNSLSSWHPVAKGTGDGAAGDDTHVEGAHEKARSKLSSDGGGSGINEKGGSSREAGFAFTIDTDVLHCAVCSDQLSPPIFQCCNGPLACSSCKYMICSMAGNNCPSSKSTAISCRNLAVEKIIESIKVPCPYAGRGCEQLISYLNVRVHKEMCEYSPFHCPAANCNFEAPKRAMRELYHHFVQGHPGRSISFQYNRSFRVSMSEDDHHFRVLHAHEDEVLFLLYIISDAKLRKSMVACLGPDTMSRQYTYKVKARDDAEIGGRGSVQLKSPMIHIRELKDLELLSDEYCFLLIPEGFGGLYLDLKINHLEQEIQLDKMDQLR